MICESQAGYYGFSTVIVILTKAFIQTARGESEFGIGHLIYDSFIHSYSDGLTGLYPLGANLIA